MLLLRKHTILIHHYDTENSKTTSSVYRVFTFKTACAHTHTDAHMPASQCHMHHPRHSNTHTHTHTGTPPASVHTHNVFLSPVAHRGLGKWSGMEEISTLIALFIYTGKAQGIWNMFTYGGRNVPSRLRNATQSPRNKSTQC